jgi:23S rRNA (cytosine1962-C5)-methyltransferase
VTGRPLLGFYGIADFFSPPHDQEVVKIQDYQLNPRLCLAANREFVSKETAISRYQFNNSSRRRRSETRPERLPERLPLVPDDSTVPASAVLSNATWHPSVYRKRIKALAGNPRLGDWVCVQHEDGESGARETFAFGLYNPKSEVALRLVHWGAQPPGDAWWDATLDRAVSLRRDTLGLDAIAECYRVLHAEGDGVPGVVVDRYGDCLSAEVFSAAMAPRVVELLERLARRLGTRHWLIQPSPHLLSQEGVELPPQSSEGLPRHTTVVENGVKYRIHFGTGHKTGFFCDQRDNRLNLASYCRDRSVLDLCCYTGGFSIMAAAVGGAREVTGVDLDEEPLKTARQNAALNGVRVKFTQADAFAYMRDMLRLGRMFDVVVLDPPKLIRNRAELEEGTRKHFDLNRLAMQLVAPGGMLLTCTCAGLLPDSDFSRLVMAAAKASMRPSEWNPKPQPRQPQILAKTGAAACHPVSVTCPETEYLTAIWMRF